MNTVLPLTGPGTVSAAAELPVGFDTLFSSFSVPAGMLRLHAVIGGDGPPLLLAGGWPQTWYSWRHIMPALARRFTVVVLEARGVGRSDKPATGYDSATVAADLVAAMEHLGYPRFSAVGHDIGMWITYAIATDFRDRISQLAVIDATIPGLSPSPPLLAERRMSDFLWHFNFNRAMEINERLVEGREELYFGYQFDTKAGNPAAITPSARQHYFDALKDPLALRASFEYYRALDLTIPQNAERKANPLTIPVLAVGGSKGVGPRVAGEMRTVAADVREAVIDGSGHFVQEEAPASLLALLEDFLA